MYIYQTDNWPRFTWDRDLVGGKLAKVNKEAGFLEGRLAAIGFDAMQHAAVEALTHDIVSSSEIEGWFSIQTRCAHLWPEEWAYI